MLISYKNKVLTITNTSLVLAKEVEQVDYWNESREWSKHIAQL